MPLLDPLPNMELIELAAPKPPVEPPVVADDGNMLLLPPVLPRDCPQVTAGPQNKAVIAKTGNVMRMGWDMIVASGRPHSNESLA